MADDAQAVAIAETIAEAEATARQGQLKEGDEIYNVEMADGMNMRRSKESSKVMSNGVPLPERMPFYHSRTGQLCRLPTAQLAYYLSKRFQNGKPVFVKERPGGQPEPIDQTCEVCEKRFGHAKQFYEEFDYIAHMENKHPREWRIIQDRQKTSAGEFMKALMDMDADQRAVLKQLLGGDNGNVQGATGTGAQQGGARIPCPGCGKLVKPRGLATHQRQWCKDSGSGSGADAGSQAV